MSIFAMEAREAAEDASRRWWIYLLTGIAWLIVSLAIFRFDYVTVSSISILFGFVALFFGVNEFLDIAGSSTGWKITHALFGVLFVIAGVIALARPFDTFAALAGLMSFFLVFVGLLDIVIAFATHGEVPFWWVTLIAGIIEVLLGFWAAGYFGRQAFLLVVWVGAMCLVRGITQLVFAFKLHSLGKRLQAA